ncbi:MAG: Ig-like domain-containing protein [Ruminococcus sp.]|nr:Ig-like domain-containing protein [Ruminococcus sp.]
MKKLLSITIVLVMLLGMIPTVFAEETKTYKVQYFKYDKGDSLHQLDYINISNTSTEINEGESYISKLSPKTDTIEIDSLVVIMGENTPVYPTKNDDGSYVINIPKVRGDICIAVSIMDIGLPIYGGHGYNYYITNLTNVSSEYCNELKERNSEIATTQIKGCGTYFFKDVFTPDKGYEIVDFKVTTSDNFNENQRDITDDDGIVAEKVVTKNDDGSYTISVTGGASIYVTAVAEPKTTESEPTSSKPTSTIPGGAYVTYNLTNVISSNMQEEVWGYYETTLSPVQGYKINYISVKQGDEDMPVIDNGDGTYTFKNEGGFTAPLTITATAEPDPTASSKPTSTIPDTTYAKVNHLYDSADCSSNKATYCRIGSRYTTTLEAKPYMNTEYTITDVLVVMNKDTFVAPKRVNDNKVIIDIPYVTGDITIGVLKNTKLYPFVGETLGSFATNMENVSFYRCYSDGLDDILLENQIFKCAVAPYSYKVVPDEGYEIVSFTPKTVSLNRDTGEYTFDECSFEKTENNEYLVKEWGRVKFEGEVRKIQSQAKLSASQLTLKAGESKTLKVTDGTAKSWATSNKNVATVNNGKVTAVSKGTATITATLTTGEKLTCKVTVTTSPSLTSTNISLKSGTSKTLKAVGGTVRSWTTSNKKVATVNNGKVTALNKGTATVTATLTTGKKLTCKVMVTTAPKLSKTTVKVKKGGTATVKVSGKVATINNKYTNTKVAKITSKTNATTLKIKGLKKGTTSLKIKVNAVKTLNLKVNVK